MCGSGCLLNLFVVAISQSIHTSNHYVVHLELLYINYISIKKSPERYVLKYV